MSGVYKFVAIFYMIYVGAMWKNVSVFLTVIALVLNAQTCACRQFLKTVSDSFVPEDIISSVSVPKCWGWYCGVNVMQYLGRPTELNNYFYTSIFVIVQIQKKK